jgi:hypothetical protein
LTIETQNSWPPAWQALFSRWQINRHFDVALPKLASLPRRLRAGPVSAAANGGLVKRTVQAVNACAAQRNASLDRCSIDRAPSSLRLAGGVVSKIH